MAEEATPKPANPKGGGATQAKRPATSPRREIPGNLPYLNASGTLKRVLDRVIELAKPDKFNYDFLENVVKITGGAARSAIPIMKKMGFLNSDNSPTEIYSRFRTEGGRSAAAHQGLRNAFPEIFRRSDYAHAVEDAKLRDIIMEITGLKSNDPVAQAIRSTFGVIKGYITPGYNPATPEEAATPSEPGVPIESPIAGSSDERPLGLTYNINIVLPETSDINVLNAIFRSVRDNLLK